jgi:hypothetical protein
MMSIIRQDPALAFLPHDPAQHLADEQTQHPSGPELTDLELEEIVARIGRGVRALASDALIDQIPREFQRLLDSLERSERDRKA